MNFPPSKSSLIECLQRAHNILASRARLSKYRYPQLKCCWNSSITLPMSTVVFLYLMNCLYVVALLPFTRARRLFVSRKDFGLSFRSQGSWGRPNDALVATANVVTQSMVHVLCRLCYLSTARPTLCATEIELESCAGAVPPASPNP